MMNLKFYEFHNYSRYGAKRFVKHVRFLIDDNLFNKIEQK